MAGTMNSVDTGIIEVTRLDDIQGGPERLEYKWVGGPKVSITRELLSQMGMDNVTIGDVISIGPYELKIVDENIIAWDTVEAIRVDKVKAQ